MRFSDAAVSLEVVNEKQPINVPPDSRPRSGTFYAAQRVYAYAHSIDNIAINFLAPDRLTLV
jgi:hypothetical protein